MPFKDRQKKKEYQRQWYARNRAEFFAGKRCERCGSTHEMELHHQDPSQKISCRFWSWKKERREAEIAKCIVLCRVCHQEHHAEERRRKAMEKFANINQKDWASLSRRP
jgi:hypothetical protein